ncbi:substrate-binding periplasmic protein [Vibrio ostreicida]|uniref:Transporter substrate-binding domain-containing protein n=1 Tax=Vibrio ostreicida TaxID=526588 RepID=A0ABT8BXX3_9VIBR|nr:transporter substrate-binding domain-containing protein [Vibrio ostreicida]MDN3611996.1 transporter substrate-binding domain-containing protein [Vibrio ostreicida]NPD08830.1 transporter substrate-binding domain-containing protein [Vibrio ostreicida]
MNVNVLWWLLALPFSSVGYAASQELSTRHLNICGDSIDWPPYTYVDGEEVKGFDVDVLNQVLSAHNITFNITMTSWTRCLKGTKDGDFQLAVSASYSEERAKHYLYTAWYYQVTPYFMYSKQRFPDGVNISNVTDLSQYKVCGIHGYNYADFQLKNIDQYTHNMFELVKEIREKRCEIVVVWNEIVEGIKRLWGIDYVTGEIAAQPIPNMHKHKFYMLVSKKFEEAEALQQLLNKALPKFQSQ